MNTITLSIEFALTGLMISHLCCFSPFTSVMTPFKFLYIYYQVCLCYLAMYSSAEELFCTDFICHKAFWFSPTSVEIFFYYLNFIFQVKRKKAAHAGMHKLAQIPNRPMIHIGG